MTDVLRCSECAAPTKTDAERCDYCGYWFKQFPKPLPIPEAIQLSLMNTDHTIDSRMFENLNNLGKFYMDWPSSRQNLFSYSLTGFVFGLLGVLLVWSGELIQIARILGLRP